MGLPGDLANATRFWGAAAANPATCRTTNSLTLADPKLTCDGNGSGFVRDSGTYDFESYRFWQQLANAGMIEGSYSGIVDTGNTLDATPGFNVPTGRIANTGFSVYYQYNTSAEFFDTYPVYKNLIFFGGERVGNPYAPVLTPAETWNIDTKLDDGNPARGRITSSISTSAIIPNCTVGTDVTTAAYNLAASDRLCAFILIPGF